MYCKNCGNQMDENAVVCVKCGCAKGTGISFCPNCGQAIAPNAAVCTSCGSALVTAPVVTADSKSKLAAGLLGIFLGSLGVHNFYLGFTGKAVAQLLITVLSCGVLSAVSGVWGLIEGVMILAGNTNKDAKGNALKD
ncbi:MAG: TM2 domain-containing protein [Oscillospiraceae bacterium]|nr:TM2 domain-containing protein [Oscillospiraceae bacterium]